VVLEQEASVFGALGCDLLPEQKSAEGMNIHDVG
jgi:hypothetical protein